MPVTVRENLVPIWSPRQNMTKFRNWSHMPKINIYTAPPPLPPPKKTLTQLDAESSADLLDQAAARWPLQLGAWDGAALRDVGPGIGFGRADLVCKISDSYLGIGDKVLARGVDFSSLADVEAALQADPQYAGKRAVLSELMRPAAEERVQVSSGGFSQARCGPRCGPRCGRDAAEMRSGGRSPQLPRAAVQTPAAPASAAA